MTNSFRPYSIDQAYLLPQAPREWLPEGHLAFFLEETVGLLDLIVQLGMAKSKSEARRLVEQNAVSIEGEPVREATRRLGAGSYLLKVGKRRFAQVRLV